MKGLQVFALIIAILSIVENVSVSCTENVTENVPHLLGAMPPPVALYQGYDSVNSVGLSTAVNGTYVVVGGTSSVTYTICEDTESIYKALDVSQSAFVGFLPFFGTREKSRFVDKLKLSTYSLSIVIHARHVQGTETATSFQLKEGVQPPVDDSGLREFFRYYGDSFVSSRTLGSEYYAVYTFTAQSRTEQQKFSSSLKAFGFFGYGIVSADFKKQIDDVKSSTKLAVTFNQEVAGIANPQLPTEENLVNYAISFPSIPIDSPAILSYESTGYEHVMGINNFGPIVNNRFYFLGVQDVDGLAADLVHITDLKNTIDKLQSIYDFYNFANDQKPGDVMSQVRKDISAISSQVQTFTNDPVANFTSTPWMSLQFGVPQLQYGISQSPQQGGNGGRPFDDVDITSYLQQRTRISSLCINTGTFKTGKKTWFKKQKKHTTVFQLQVTYQTADGAVASTRHGQGGSPSNTLQLLPGQFITKMVGRSASEVDRLEVTISDGRKVIGGGGAGSAFNWNMPKGAVLLGFSGRSQNRLDQIKAVYATLQPANWVSN